MYLSELKSLQVTSLSRTSRFIV